MEHICCQFQIKIKSKSSQTDSIMRDNRTDDTIFIFYMAHTPTHTEESAH